MNEIAENIAQSVKESTASLSDEDKVEVIVKMTENLPSKQQDLVSARLSPVIGIPSNKTRDKLWLIVIWAMSIVLVISVLVISYGIFQEIPSDPLIAGELIMSVFTAVIGFIAGLFSPPPGEDKPEQDGKKSIVS